MKKILSFFAGVALMATANGQTTSLQNGFLFSSNLNGAQVVPSVTTQTVGTSSLFVTLDRDSAYIRVSVNGLSGPITGIGIHGGLAGQNGDSIISLLPYVQGSNIAALLPSSSITPSLFKKLLKDSLYISVHTAAHPTGEVRGQLRLEADKVLSAFLEGGQEVPAVITPATGLGGFKLSRDQKKLKVKVLVQGLSSPITGAHLHLAPPGVNGPVIEHLTSFVNDSLIIAEVDPSDYISALLHDSVYINVHTSNHPNGEIRGQLQLHKEYLKFGAWLDSTHVPTPNDGEAFGKASLKINATLDTIKYHIVAKNITDSITAAHLHIGASGPLAFDLSEGINGNTVSGTIAGDSLTADFVNSLLHDSVHVVLASPTHPQGEIHGPLHGTLRKSFTFSLSGSQQVPVTNSPATGSGFVTVESDTSSLYYSVVVSNLTGPLTSAHFHVAPIGENGSVVHDITNQFERADSNDAAWGYWDQTNGFDSTDYALLLNDSIYINLHTANFPGGEVRGQVLAPLRDTTVVTASNDELITSSSYTISPNPSTEKAYVVFNATTGTTGQLSVSDAYGKVVYAQSIAITRGDNQISLNVVNLEAGLYHVSVSTENTQVSQKLVKK